jgi:hypothetical protein
MPTGDPVWITIPGLPTLDVVDAREEGTDPFGGRTWTLTVDASEHRIGPGTDLDDVVLQFVDGEFDGRAELDDVERRSDGETYAHLSVTVDASS